MNKIAFSQAFHGAVESACQSTEKALGICLSRSVRVRMYGGGENGIELSSAEFIDRAYINEELFYRVVDLMIVEVVGIVPIFFARISGHPPAALSRTWNGNEGPFKLLTADQIARR